MAAVRRIVTATCGDGIGRVIASGAAEAVKQTGGGGSIREIWRTASLTGSELCARVEDMPADAEPAFAPPAGGTGCRIVTIPPDSERWGSPEALLAVARAIGADRPAAWLDRHPGMHLTPTLDYAVLLSGRLVLVMEEGEVELAPGDVIVQQAAAHAWKNTGTVPAVMFVVMLGMQDSPVGE